MTPTLPVWIDTDLAIGAHDPVTGYADVDDAYALLHLLRSEQWEVAGISTVFGNTDLATATRLAGDLLRRFGPPELAVHAGAAGPLDLQQVVPSPAVKALAAALARRPMSVLAIGPATNIATLLLCHPELASQLEQVVLVAGRRSPEQHFAVGPQHNPPFPDLNFDLDPDAFRILLQHDVPVVLVPFEVSHKVWITAADLDALEASGEAGRYLAGPSRPWLAQWAPFGATAFNPFDVLASGYLIDPQGFGSSEFPVELQLHPDDTQPRQPGEPQAFKPYLICSPEVQSGRKVRYCHTPPAGFKTKLWEQLGVTKA